MKCDGVQVASIGEEVVGGPSAITSITATPDGEYLLANFRDHTTHLWRLGPIVRRILRPLPGGNDLDPYGLAPEGNHTPPPLPTLPDMHAHQWVSGRIWSRR